MTKLTYEPIHEDEYLETVAQLYSLFEKLRVLFEEPETEDEKVIDINSL